MNPDTFKILVKDIGEIENAHYNSFRVIPSTGEIFSYLNYRNTREVIRMLFNVEIDDNLIYRLRDQYFFFLNKIMMAREQSKKNISFSVLLMSDFFKILDSIIQIIQHLSIIVKAVLYIGPSKIEMEEYSWYGNLIPFFE